MPQSSFEFNFDTPQSEGDFIVSSSNANALAYIEKWPGWKGHALLLYGPKASGKTHLVTIWQKKTRALFLKPSDIYSKRLPDLLGESKCCIVDGIEKVHDEVALLHFFNAVKEAGGWLLLTAQKHPSNAHIRLPDLKSRLNAVAAVGVGQPDDELLKQMFTKYFADRQLKVGADVIAFIIARMERSFEALRHIVDALDNQALSERRNITVPFAKKVLESMEKN